MKKIIEKFLRLKNFEFESKSLENSQMDWNNKGWGKIVKVMKIEEETPINKSIKIYFDEKIFLENGMELKDRKMWEISNKKIKFYHFRNNIFEKIFEFICDENEKYVMKKIYECKPDNYFGNLKILENKIIFEIKIVGKRKNEKIKYVYQIEKNRVEKDESI